jgi:D-alanyl-D-alanine endopeptidase (penicillin-binding protein 7)
MIKKIIVICLTLSVFLLGDFCLAEDLSGANEIFYTNLDKNTIDKGFTVSTPDNNLKLSLTPGILSDSTGVETVKINEEMEMPWRVDKISGIYQFEFKNKTAYDSKKPFYIQLSYEKITNNYKQVFFYDKNFNSWRPLPTTDYPEKMFVRSLIHLPFARLAVFDYPGILTAGQASWYKYKGGNFAASPDFPKGSRVRVYNTANNKFVDVEINDYGPERNLHPARVVDLDKKAFSKIASTRDGIINVKVEPLEIKPHSGKILDIPKEGAKNLLDLTVKAATIVNGNNDEIIWSSNATSSLPLASLTKLVAIKVFLDTKPTLSEIITYRLKDEEYNYQYAKKWELARLKLEEGETLTIEDLIYSSLVGSANNTVETLVRASGIKRDVFIAEMNEIVKNWGCSSTFFVEPTGLSPENLSSAQDYVIIAKEALKHPIIQKATQTSEYKFFTIKDGKKKQHRIINTNKIILANNFKITGSKTGYLEEAGYCLMTRVEAAGGKQIIVVTLGAPSRDASFNETEELIEYGLRKIK